jgi:hypothetical protein
MSHRRSAWGRDCLCWMLVLAGAGLFATGVARGACYSTPDAAIEAVKPGSSLSPVSDGRGYRVTGIQSDPVLGHRWAMIASCDHPGWPVFSLRVHANDLVATPLKTHEEGLSVGAVVHVGDIVRLWKQEDFLRIEVAGVSEDNGGLGKTIRVRLLRRDTDEQMTQEQMSGIVRGPLDVEMQP